MSRMFLKIVQRTGRGLLSLLVAGLLLGRSASAVVINFSDLPPNTIYGYTISDSGYTFHEAQSGLFTMGSTIYGGILNYLQSSISDSTAGGTTVMTYGGGAFNVSSVAVAAQHTSGLPTVTFTGTYATGGTVTQSIATTTLAAFTVGNLVGFNDLVSLSWVQASPYNQLTNFNVVPTPEPHLLLLTLSLLAAFLISGSRTSVLGD